MDSELIKLENVNALEIFTVEGIDPLLEKITSEVKNFVPDLETKKGRDEIKSLAYRVSTSKTYLDDLGKKLTEDWKKKSKIVDNSRKKMRKHLENLRDEVRKPLTDWENIEKDRVEKHQEAVANLVVMASSQDMFGEKISLKGLKENLQWLINNPIDESWEEFEEVAKFKKEKAINDLTLTITNREKAEAERAELERLRKEKAEQEQKERDHLLTEQAAKKAREDAELREREHRVRLEREKHEAVAREKQAEERAKQAEIDKKEVAARAEREKIETAARIEKEKIESAKKAELEKKLAAERAIRLERERVANKEAYEKHLQEKQKANEEHRSKIDKIVITALLDTGIVNNGQAASIVKAIADEKIPNVSINY